MSSTNDVIEQPQVNMNGCSCPPGVVENGEVVTNKPKPPIPAKPSVKPPVKPPVKRKPLSKTQSVDTYMQDNRADLTQVGDSEWKDFVLKRQESDEDAQPPAIRSLNLHRQSLTGSESTITENQVFDTSSLNHDASLLTTEKTIVNKEDSVVPTPAVVDCNQSDKPNLDKNVDGEVSPDKLNGECKQVTDDTSAEKPVSVSNGIDGVDSTNKENTEKTVENTAPTPAENTAPTPAFTLPKPRQIVSEIKRQSFATNRSMSLPATHLAPQIKRSSDILKEASGQTPYFCRLSRGSVDLNEIPGLSGLSIKEDTASENKDQSES